MFDATLAKDHCQECMLVGPASGQKAPQNRQHTEDLDNKGDNRFHQWTHVPSVSTTKAYPGSRWAKSPGAWNTTHDRYSGSQRPTITSHTLWQDRDGFPESRSHMIAAIMETRAAPKPVKTGVWASTKQTLVSVNFLAIMFPILRDMSSIEQFPVGSPIIHRQLGQPLSGTGRVNTCKVNKTLSVGHMGCHHFNPSPFHSPHNFLETSWKTKKMGQSHLPTDRRSEHANPTSEALSRA